MTFTKERITNLLEFNSEGSDCQANAEQWEVHELARIAQASLEAEAVAWLLSGGGAKNHVSLDIGNAYADPLREVTPLYAAPQLPQPAVVPDAIEIDDDFDSAFEHGKAVGWNACRAAMLQGADGNAPAHFRSRPAQSSLSPAQGGNSPVTPDCWVPCSERLPEETKEPDGGATGYLVLYAEGKEPNGGFNVGVWNVTYLRQWWRGFITHWMPLPAAPQQEAE
ncbi:DUF551 domain-containing protein [Salmonella enterica subsp. enterica serovar Infantis]|uniref:DUF551 domain-containing protein n=1 Tax=Salmonella enterica TaxID=28901 RepID=UPI001DCE9D99|nr:DUF551 domain-containing protein [Salmonella enterica]EEL8156186.1 DUF551 domain-containing protein [Salmonella enterica subsp. enterica serovar Infantis]EBH8421357.1 DUF551 domain-containing protein [Salmonella enterica subsp. enterica serovar Isangi]EDS4438604.1 DUF551 domain-containing protein [Salmonella enterica subsp. enterica serovar Isangi]EDU1597437.1 DUF551 domain-containing protein [Salmonella enterica subsp. enterica serovar Isangi]EGU7031440.1 DUF551 domain-containing protein [